MFVLKMNTERLTQEFITAQVTAGMYQFCPAGGCLVEKISGCNYVECGCGAKFCWNCKKLKGAQCPYGNAKCNSH